MEVFFPQFVMHHEATLTSKMSARMAQFRESRISPIPINVCKKKYEKMLVGDDILQVTEKL